MLFRSGSLLCHRTTDATVKTASATGEISSGSAVYSAVFSNVAAGKYRLKLLASGSVVATRDVEFAGTDAEVVETGYVVLDTAGEAMVTAFNAMRSGNVFTAPALANAPTGGGGGGGGGSPVFTAVVVARIATGAAAGWPEDLTIGDAYLSENAGAQPLFIKDVEDNILSGLGTKLFSDADFVATLRLAPLTDGTRTLDTPPTTIEVKSIDDVGILYNDDTAGAEYFELQIPRSKTLLGVTKTKYSCQFIMNWGVDNTYERTVNLGEIKFLRKNAPAS